MKTPLINNLDNLSVELLQHISETISEYRDCNIPNGFQDTDVTLEICSDTDCQLSNSVGQAIFLNDDGMFEFLIVLPVSKKSGTLSELCYQAEAGEISDFNDLLELFEVCDKSKSKLPLPTGAMMYKLDAYKRGMLIQKYTKTMKFSINYSINSYTHGFGLDRLVIDIGGVCYSAIIEKPILGIKQFHLNNTKHESGKDMIGSLDIPDAIVNSAIKFISEINRIANKEG